MRWLWIMVVSFVSCLAQGQELDEIERIVNCRDGFERLSEVPRLIGDYLDSAEAPERGRAAAISRKWAYVDAMPRDEQSVLNEWDEVVDEWFGFLASESTEEAISEATLREWLGQMQNYGKPGSHAAAARGLLRYARLKLAQGDTTWAGYYGEQVFRSSAAVPDRWEAFRLWTMDADAIEGAAHYAGLILDREQDPLMKAELPFLFNNADGKHSARIRQRLVEQGLLDH